jgi:hypothetical protein
MTNIPFEKFIETLKTLEADGFIRVEKWPLHEKDDFKLTILKDEHGNAIKERMH